MRLSGGDSVTTPLRPWRVTTAVRVFALAVAIGMVLSSPGRDDSWEPLAALIAVATVSSVLEWGRMSTRATRTLTLVEAIAAATIISTTPDSTGALAYIAVPAIAAGVRHGWVITVNTAMAASVIAMGAMGLVHHNATAARVAGLLLWLVIGLGVGLLASWQSRSMRLVEARQAPLTAAHSLMVQLHRLARRGEVGLDTTQLAEELCDKISEVTSTPECVVVALSPSGVEALLAHRGSAGPDPTSDGLRGDSIVSIPLRATGELLGYVRVTQGGPWPPGTWERAVAIADDFALRLGTSLLFDGVRRIAADEERNRIARDMHDGVAQDIVALGYTVDDIEASSSEPEVQQLAVALREEITRLVSELRLSIFDLRNHAVGRGLAGRIADDVQELTKHRPMRVHLELDETGAPWAPPVAHELVRIVQEAVRNAIKHSAARNLWVTYRTDGSSLLLQIKDDGSGTASPRAGHFGLQTMHERATSVGASFAVTSNVPRGTTVSLTIGDTEPHDERTTREHDSVAG